MAGLGDARPITSAIGSGLIAASAFTGPAAPFVAAAGALTSLIGSFFKPDLTKVEATHIVDQIEAQYLKPNLVTWQSFPADQKTQSAQAAAVALFDKAWAAVVQGCSNPALGTAGQNCINDRVRGGKWPWPVYYRDPIANDPTVVPDPSMFGGDSVPGSVSASIDSAIAGLSQALGAISPLAIGIGLVAVGFLLVSD